MAIPIDLDQRFRYRLWAVILTFAVALGLTLWLGYDDVVSRRDASLRQQIESASENILRRIDFYGEAANQLAREPEVLTLIQSGDAAEQQAWAETHRRTLPGLLGLALVDKDGSVLGHASALRVGAQCQRDPQRPGSLEDARIQGQRAQPGLERFDLVVWARKADGECGGGLLMSLRSSPLQRVIDDSRYPGHALMLLDANGRTIAQTDGMDARAASVEVPLRDTGWRLRVQKPPLSMTTQMRWTMVNAGAALLIVLAIMLEGIARLRRNIQHDLATIRDGLAAVAADAPLPSLVPVYQQFQPAMQEIERIAGEIQLQRAEFARLSLTDALTGLPNRRALEGRFSQMLGFAQREYLVSLVLLDLDYFKSLNDSRGHAAGDQALQALAVTLNAVSRNMDYPVRLAGDEFVMVLTGLDAEGVAGWFLRLSDRFRAELRALGIEHGLGISGGQTWLRGNDTLGRVLTRADRALYRAKAEGRGKLVFHVDEDQ